MSTNGELLFKSLKTFLKPILPLWEDIQISEIQIHGTQGIWVDRTGTLEKVDILFPEPELVQGIRKIGQFFGVLLNEDNPFLHHHLSDGTEISLLLPPLSPSGSILVIRKPVTASTSLVDLCQSDVLSPAVADFLRLACLTHQSILVVGTRETLSHQLVQALIQIIPSHERMVCLEQGIDCSLQHPNLWPIRIDPAQTKDDPLALQKLFPAVIALRPQRLVIENLAGQHTPFLLSWLTNGYPGSFGTLRASHIQHAMQILETYGMQFHDKTPLLALRTQIATAFPLVVACRQGTNGEYGVDEVSEILPLSAQGLYRFLPIFRRQTLQLNVSNPSNAVLQQTAEALLPTGNIPSFWPYIRHLEQGLLDRAFFHPANYDEWGRRQEGKSIPSAAPIGIPAEEEEVDTRFRSSRERETHDNFVQTQIRAERPVLGMLSSPVEPTAPSPVQPDSVPVIATAVPTSFVSSNLSQADKEPETADVSRAFPIRPPVEPAASTPIPASQERLKNRAVATPESEKKNVLSKSAKEPEPVGILERIKAVDLIRAAESARAIESLQEKKAPQEGELGNKKEGVGGNWGAVEPFKRPVFQEQHAKNSDDVITEPGRNLQELVSETEPPSVSVTIPPAFAIPDDEQEVQDTNSLSKLESDSFFAGMEVESRIIEKLPTQISPSSPFLPERSEDRSSEQKGPYSPSPGGGISLFSVPGKKNQEPGMVDSAGMSSILTVSRVTPSRDKSDAVSTAPHVPLDSEMMAIVNNEPINESHHILELSDVIADESPSIVSEEDLRWVEQELRRPSPVQSREQSTTMLPNPALITEVVTRERMIAQPTVSGGAPPSLPDEDLYTDPEDTFRQGKTPLLHANQTKSSSQTERETASVEEMGDMTFIPAQNATNPHPSVMVRRGSRQVVAPPMPTTRIEHESTSIRGQSPVRGANPTLPPASFTAPETMTPVPPVSSSFLLPPDNDATLLPDKRPVGIRPPSTPGFRPPTAQPQSPPPSPSSNTQAQANDATLIREKRPPRFKS